MYTGSLITIVLKSSADYGGWLGSRHIVTFDTRRAQSANDFEWRVDRNGRSAMTITPQH